jgi:hypothetical protein
MERALPHSIEQRIFTIRGWQVMLDKDLAVLYGVSTSRLNEQVRRNASRFPENFSFYLTADETRNWISQNATSKSIKMGLRKPPRLGCDRKTGDRVYRIQPNVSDSTRTCTFSFSRNEWLTSVKEGHTRHSVILHSPFSFLLRESTPLTRKRAFHKKLISSSITRRTVVYFCHA